ncbi:Radial spoke head protein 4 A [Geranomyces variabilis]|nr:Radial spoke head protein 4 A [Geranomyces variabilis]
MDEDSTSAVGEVHEEDAAAATPASDPVESEAPAAASEDKVEATPAPALPAEETAPASEEPRAAPAPEAPAPEIAAPKVAEEPLHPFLNRKDHYVKPNTRLPEDSELALAKAFLMSQSDKSNLNLYDHLTEVVMRILETRPADAVDVFETISADTKRSHFTVHKTGAPGAFLKVQDVPPASEVGAAQVKLFERSDLDAGAEETDGEIPDILDLATLWEWAGVSFGKDETFMLFLAIKRLIVEKPLKSVRLWGKILGTRANYIVIEGELREGADDEDEAIANDTGEAGAPAAEEEEAAPDAGGGGEEGAEGESQKIEYPKRKVKPTVPLPKEERTGVNKYVYYVCNYAGGVWMRLPDVVPEKLQAARRIRKYFTGDLKHKIVSYPPFNGNEAQYLRCQIARISAATVVSPTGYYAFDQEEDADEDEENGAAQRIIINPEYEPLPNDQLVDPANWVHHVPYVLPQGRVKWENPTPPKNGDDEDGNDDEDRSDAGSEGGEGGDGEGEPAEPETGPPILSPLAGDEEHDGMASWVARMCSSLSPSKFSPVLLRCTRWPGATVVSYNEKFANVYIGDGQRDTPRFVPPPLAELQKEYASGPGAPGTVEDITEQNDPTLAEETAFEEEKRAREEEQQEESDDEGDEGDENASDA